MEKPSGRARVRKPAGGFVFVSAVQLCLAWWAYRAGHIRYQDLRAYLASHELVARRCGLVAGRSPTYGFHELQRLLGARHEASVRGSIRRLTKVGLLRWGRGEVAFAVSPDELRVEELGSFWDMLELVENHRRKVPVPRRTLRLLAGGARRAVVATTLGHLLRCVYYRQGGCTFEGACKSSWVADVFGIAESKAKEARAHLRAIGWLRVEVVPQWYVNRYGARIVVDLAWEQNGSKFSTAETGPLEREIATESGPPMRNQKPPTESYRNQEPAKRGPATGVCTEGLKSPNIKHVLVEDLKSMHRVLELFEQASKRGLVDGGDRGRLSFVAGAEHALVIGSKNPCGLFAWNLRHGFPYVSNSDEDAALRRLKEHFYGKPERSAPERTTWQGPTLSNDARFVRELRAALRRRGHQADPFPYIHRERPEWTRERWERATRELEEAQLVYARAAAEREDELVLEGVA